MDRIMVFNRLDAYLCDLDPKKVHGLRSVEEVNGEHALTITTTHQLEKTNRIVLKDGMGHWHEYVVTGIVDTHETDEGLVTEYYCVWSIQYDLSGTFVDNQYGCGIVPGHASVPHPVQDALTIALSTTNRWQIGTVNVTSMAAASFYRRSGWEAIQTVIEKWGGELQATIDVGQGGVVARYVDLLEHVGASSATRRFDYGHDVASIKRTVSDEVWPCRIIPLGASQETDEGGYTRRPTIESVNSGVMWLEDAEVVPLTRMPDGNGGWEYPTAIVENDTYEVPADLKAWAIANITDYTRPRVTYEASVVQLARAGMNPHGVALGDEVVVVDREFGSDGLRITARVVRQECNLLDPTDTVLTIGNISDKLSGQLADLSRQVSEVVEQVASASSYQSSTEYVSRLLERINDEANATGGFTYITEGQGIRTYDVAVTDPLVGTEASSVVEVKGGTIRIANTKTAQGQWEWKTIFTSGYVNAEVIRAIGLLTGSHVEVDTNGVHIYDQNGTEVALYAPTVRIGVDDNAHVKMLLEPNAMAIENESGSEIFSVKANSTGTKTVTVAAEVVKWETETDVTTTANTVSDARATAGDATVTATVADTDYTLDSTHATATVTAGTGVSVALTSVGVDYVQSLMSDAEVTTGTLSVEYQRTVADSAQLDLNGNQIVTGVGRAMRLHNDQWSSSSQTETFYVAKNEFTDAAVLFGVGSGGWNRGLFDAFTNSWLIYRNQNGQTIIGGSNFSVSSSGAIKTRGGGHSNLSGRLTVGNRVTATDTGGKVSLVSGATTGNKGIWDETDGVWIIYRHPDYGIVLGNSAADTLYHRTSTCTVTTANATIYNNVNHCWQNGAACTVCLSVNLKSSLSNASTVDVATVPANYRPPYAVMGSVYVPNQSVNLQAELLGAGTIRVNNRSGSAVTTSANIYISFTFAL